jgi:hypothetical protein
LRNCLTNGLRAAFVILSIAAALLVNGLYASYAQRVGAASATFRPGQPVVVVVNARGVTEETRLARSPAVSTYETVVVQDAFARTARLEVWRCLVETRLAVPSLLSGRMPAEGQCVVPRSVADALDLDIGSHLSVFTPAAEAKSGQWVVVGISDDGRFPVIIAPAPEGATVNGKKVLLARLVPGTDVTRWTRQIGFKREAVRTLGDDPAAGGAARSLADRLQEDLAGVILLVAALGVANGLALALVEREAQTALLRALGVSWRQVALVYLVEALALTVLGVVVALGVACWAAMLAPLAVGARLPGCVLRGSLTAACSVGASRLSAWPPRPASPCSRSSTRRRRSPSCGRGRDDRVRAAGGWPRPRSRLSPGPSPPIAAGPPSQDSRVHRRVFTLVHGPGV